MAAKTGSMFKSVLGANLVSGALTSGISAISGGIRSMGTELNSSQKPGKHLKVTYKLSVIQVVK